ncbi:MAG: hypothetical protein KJ852_16655 [Gammaproteobacteria bacterium]|jgi:hypothetical protein|nr:hypothetical protein [Gammaproteobacteria bacterium]MBU0786854.1 hypothetical protein [Gammaproteobacteria bacterium]MBU0813940.1 hypothetical protein [Gammaproteobacteria bacterium]MBU1788587.1 hypothetical protein [Gammaproteobacteria bacterium]
MKFPTLITTLALLVGNGANAAGQHGHDDKPLHGGVVAEARDLHFELVAHRDKVRLYVRDHGTKHDVREATAALTLLHGADKQEVTLVPQGEWLGASGTFKIGKGTKAALVFRQTGKTVVVRFVLP